MSLELVRRDDEAVRRRTRIALAVSFVIHVLVSGWCVLFCGKGDGTPTITEVTWIDPKDLEPPPPPPKPVAKPVAPAPRPADVATASKPAARKPAAQAPQAKVARPAVPGNPGESGVARAPAPSNGGAKGRAEGARVAREMQATTASIDQMLSSLGAAAAPASQGAGGGKVTDRYAVRGGRGDGALPASDGALRGTGLGEVGAGGGAGGGKGPGRGVQRTTVAIADEGVETGGDGASASGRDSRSLMATVQRYVAGVKFCYDNALKKTPGLRGTVTLQMDIAASGEVLAVEPVDDSMGNAALERCILSQVQSWKFPAIQAGTVRFTLPLVFSPPQGSPSG